MSLPDFIEIGTARSAPPALAPPKERFARNRELLARSLNTRTTVAFVGAGATRPLGHPSWPEFTRNVVQKVLDSLTGATGDDARDPERESFVAKLKSFRARLDSGAALSADDFTYFLDVCHRSFGRFQAAGKAYQSCIDSFEQKPLTSQAHNPCRALLQLPIYRFVTTNYDTEIEAALSACRDVDFREFGISEPPPDKQRPKSFTQQPEFRNELALFALSRVPQTRNMVFHCHGRWDRPKSVVASEESYQYWYLRERDADTSSFLQTIDLLFSSNPILFVGYGIQDEDLLRPLRMFGAIDPLRRWNRPIFALMDYGGTSAEFEYFEQLLNRYGVHVIPFDRPGSSNPAAWGRALCAAIERLQHERIEWRVRWSRKPQLRQVRVSAHPPEPYWHYHIQPTPREELTPRLTERNIRDLRKKVLDERPRVLPIIGLGGTGKSWHAIRLMETFCHDPGPFFGSFFWSSYYADDALTGVERALAYLDPGRQTTGSRYERLKTCLSERPYFLVFDGFERLLREIDERGVGEAGTVDARRLIEAITSRESQSTVLLTSRVWPSALDDEHGKPLDKVHAAFTLKEMRGKDLVGHSPFSEIGLERTSALCSLLDGHSYGLALAASIIESSSPGSRLHNLEHLQVKLENQTPRNRVSRIIQRAIEDLASSGPVGGDLLQRVALFMSPVSRAVVEVCFEDACKKLPSTAPRPELQDVLDLLVSRRLLFRVAGKLQEPVRDRFTTHATVRSYIAGRMHGALTDALPNFTLTGFTSGGRLVAPGNRKAARMVTDLFDQLLEACKRSHEKRHPVDAGRLCRGAFGVLRSKMEALTVPHWTSYPDYVQHGFNLLNLVRRVSRSYWDHREKHDVRSAEAEDAPLYADEVAWLYNDLGLASHCEGDFPAAHILWDEGYEVNKLIDGNRAGPYTVQSLLHLGAAYIERGHLDEAGYYLDETKRVNRDLGDPDYAARIIGYQALVAHLRGDFDGAGKLYRACLTMLEEAEYNCRARAWFHHHYGNLLIRQGKFRRANRILGSALALAKLGQAPDLEFYARNAIAHLFRAQRRFPEAGAEYQGALEGVRRMGIRKLEADILSELSRLALDIGDAEGARWHASQSLRIANELGLGLRQTHAMVVLGLSSAHGGQRELGVAYLQLALRLARSQSYLTRAREAERALRSLGENEERSKVE